MNHIAKCMGCGGKMNEVNGCNHDMIVVAIERTPYGGETSFGKVRVRKMS
jgi:hypothetical protein